MSDCTSIIRPSRYTSRLPETGAGPCASTRAASWNSPGPEKARRTAKSVRPALTPSPFNHGASTPASCSLDGGSGQTPSLSRTTRPCGRPSARLRARASAGRRSVPRPAGRACSSARSSVRLLLAQLLSTCGGWSATMIVASSKARICLIRCAANSTARCQRLGRTSVASMLTEGSSRRTNEAGWSDCHEASGCASAKTSAPRKSNWRNSESHRRNRRQNDVL